MAKTESAATVTAERKLQEAAQIKAEVKSPVSVVGEWLGTVWVIAWKELKSFYVTWMAYVVTFFFLGLTGFMFYTILVQGRQTELRYLFWNMAVLQIFIIPVVTMKLFAEERRSGTLELMLTCPITDWQAVLGKFLGALLVLLIMGALTLYIPILMVKLANPDLGSYWTAYIGLVLFAASMAAVGVFWSAVTDSQIVAAVATFGTLLLMYIINWPAEGGTGWWSEVCRRLSLYNRFQDFTTGLMNTKDILFYVTFALLTLFLSVRVLESRRWR